MTRSGAALRAGAAAVLFLAAGELFVRGAGVDRKLLLPLLYYQGADLPVHAPNGDLEEHYGLKPGARFVFEGGRVVTVGSLGYRGPDRPAAKRPGVKRIVCLGGSAVYGASVSDAQTYPAQLERALNARGRGRFEVWNAGVNAYTIAQDAGAARRAEALLQPDLFVFMPTNFTRRTFLLGQDPLPFFEADPSLYSENLRFMPLRGTAPGASLLARWRFYAAVVFALNELALESGLHAGPANPFLASVNDWADRWVNQRALRRFVRSHPGRVVVLRHPRVGRDLGIEDFPVIDLKALLPPSAGPEYRLIHPPAAVYRWYGDAIARELLRRGVFERLVPPAEQVHHLLDHPAHGA